MDWTAGATRAGLAWLTQPARGLTGRGGSHRRKRHAGKGTSSPAAGSVNVGMLAPVMPDAVDHDGNVKDDVAAGGRPSSPKRTGRPASAYRARPPGRPGLARSHALHSPAT